MIMTLSMDITKTWHKLNMKNMLICNSKNKHQTITMPILHFLHPFYINITKPSNTSKMFKSLALWIPPNPFAFIDISCWSMFNKQVGLHKTNFYFKTFHTNFVFFIINPFYFDTHFVCVNVLQTTTHQCFISIYFHIENLGK